MGDTGIRGLRGSGGAAMTERMRALAERLYGQRAHWGGDRHYAEALAVAELVARKGLGPRLASAALLRRVPEVTDVTFGELREAGVPPRVLGLLGVLARRRGGETGHQHLARIAGCPDAEAVKRAELHTRIRRWDGTGAALDPAVTERVALDLLTGRVPHVGRMRAALGGPDATARAYATVALGRLRSREALPLLLEQYRRAGRAGDWCLYASRHALERIFSGAESTYWPLHNPMPPPPDPDTVPILEGLLADPAPHVRALAVELLGRPGDPALLPRFAAALRDADDEVADAAAVACGRTGDPSAYGLLAARLAECRGWDRRYPTVGLGLLADPRAAAPLARLLLADQGTVALAAAHALVRCAGPGTAAEVLAVLESGKERLGSAHHALWVLGELRAAEATPVLVGTLRSLLEERRSGYVAAACAEALGKLRAAEAVDLLAGAAAPGADVMSGPPTTAHLRRQAVWALGRIGDPRSADAVIAATRDAEEEVRSHAVTALTRLPGERAVAGLIGLCDTPYARRVLPALARAADPRAVPALVRVLTTTGDRRTRNLAGRALRAVGPAAAGPVGEHTGHPDPRVRRAVAWVLEGIRAGREE